MNGLEHEFRGDLYVQRVNIDTGEGNRLQAMFEVSGTPTIIIFNDAGKVVARFNGLVPENTLRQAINQALSESATNSVS